MALILIECILDEKGDYDPVRVFRAYLRWWDNGHGTDAWDTGPIAAQCLSHFAERSISLSNLENFSRNLDAQSNGRTAGANALHRVTVLACLAGDDAHVLHTARQESRLTHWSALSQDACVVAVALCRRLLQGEPWGEAVRGMRSRFFEERCRGGESFSPEMRIAHGDQRFSRRSPVHPHSSRRPLLSYVLFHVFVTKHISVSRNGVHDPVVLSL